MVDLAVHTRDHTTVGPCGLSIEDAAKFLIAFLADQAVPAPREELPKGRVLRPAYEDLKAYYGEAITTQAWELSKRAGRELAIQRNCIWSGTMDVARHLPRQ